jgi:hypothetical protein
VRTKTKTEAERVGKYMIRPVLSLERLSFLEPEEKVGYRWGQERAELETMDYLEFIARVTSHIPDKGREQRSQTIAKSKILSFHAEHRHG